MPLLRPGWALETVNVTRLSDSCASSGLIELGTLRIDGVSPTSGEGSLSLPARSTAVT